PRPPSASPPSPTRRSSDLHHHIGPPAADRGAHFRRRRVRRLVGRPERGRGGRAAHAGRWLMTETTAQPRWLLALIAALHWWRTLDRKSTRLNSSHVSISYA